MNLRTIMTISLSGLLCVFVIDRVEVLRPSAAHEPSNHINLDVVSNSPASTIVIARVSFAEGDGECPEDHHVLRIYSRGMVWIQSLPEFPPLTRGGIITRPPIDDDTEAYRIESEDCRMNLAVREQVHRDGSWVSLLVPKPDRPSLPLSLEERGELRRQLIEKGSKSVPRDRIDRWEAAMKEMQEWSSFVGTAHTFFGFEDPPQTCFEAVGDLYFERSATRFRFVTGLPGDLNRFLIERADRDANDGRLYLSRGECRFEFTATKSVLRNGEWISVPLGPTAPPKK
jgi:hypothetical protein